MNKKLVRDNIPKIISDSGRLAHTRTLQDDEYCCELIKKIYEEVEEYRDSRAIEELADIAEALYALVQLEGYENKEFENIRIKKRLN